MLFMRYHLIAWNFSKSDVPNCILILIDAQLTWDALVKNRTRKIANTSKKEKWATHWVYFRMKYFRVVSFVAVTLNYMTP